MSFSFVVEVVATPETENTERGAVLERFAKRFLETQGFKVKERLRLTGTEVDLLGTDPDFGESVLVECKAHRSTIPAPVLFQLLGTVQFKGYSAGWLLTTSQLGKDAKGVEQEWSERATGERRHLRLYSPDVLVQRLIQARVIKDPEGLMIDRERLRVSNDAHLLLSQKGEFWAIPILDRESGIQSSALLFNAETGCRITSATTLEWIERTDKSLLLPFLADEPEAQATASERLKTELESIVSVPTADHWADYWPENHSAIRTTSVSESRITRCNPVVGNDGRQPNRRYDAFLGEAPPEKVVDAVRSLRKRNWNRAEIEADHGRNTCYALVKLGLISTDGVAAADISSAPPEEIVALRARSSPTVLFVIGLLRRNRQMTGLDVGHAVARRFSMQWSEGSRKRNGGALKLWAEWAR